MEIVTGALSRVIIKLGELLVGEYKLQKGVKGGIIFLQAELESIKGALQKISNTPAHKLDEQDKIWARAVRELSYDIEDKIDVFMVHCKGSARAKRHGFKDIIDRSLDLLMRPKIHHRIATDIRDIKHRVEEIGKRRDRYKVNNNGVLSKTVTVDPRLFARYEKVVDLIGVDEARDEVIQILGEDNEVSMKQDKIVSIVGFGGLGKTTLANAVYEKLKAAFDCSAFVSVSQSPHMDKLFKDMLYQLSRKTDDSTDVINELKEFLDKKRYLVVVDDIWDTTTWRVIRCALPKDNVGCKIITTTRIFSVAEHIADFSYKLKPLSPQNSRELLYRRIFGHENKDTNGVLEASLKKEVADVSDKIIKKCAGVPLAIITIASLLANKGINKLEWYEVYNSIGTGMENSLDTENMRKILSYSYYDLPSHLRTCLLYLNIFPEGFEIRKNCLIWLWIAEGFIQGKEQGKSLFELGESYLNELINRSMIQATYDGYCFEIYSCHVHDMVLDLIRSLSSEENFVTVFNDMDQTSTSIAVRRLSLQLGKNDHRTTWDWGTKSMPQVRSFLAFSSVVDQMPTLLCFKVLRVLDLQGCALRSYNLEYLGNLLHLRYLGLRRTYIDHLPEEVGKLQFLETLDVRNIDLSYLPLTVAQLKHLMCLWFEFPTRVLNVIGGLKSLEELSRLIIEEESTDNVEVLGLLTELRVLKISLFTSRWNDQLAGSLCKLRKIQYLDIMNVSGLGRHQMDGWDDWVIPRHLRSLEIIKIWFSKLPTWINPSHLLLDLTILRIAVRELRQEDLLVLGRLPSLRRLGLVVDHINLRIYGRFVIGAGSFPCLLQCRLDGFAAPVVFQQGAMPRLTMLEFMFHLEEAKKIAGSDDVLDLGLGYLPSLQNVAVRFRSGGASTEEVDEVRAAVMKEAEVHPNCPTFDIYCLR